jgi:HEAT repeats
MDIASLENQCAAAEKTDNVAQHLKFIRELMSSNEVEVLEFHYRLLSSLRNERLFNRVRGAFGKRGLVGEQFLLKKLPREKDDEVAADILLVLGLAGSKQARRVALEFLEHEPLRHRHTACVVLGWVGTKEDEATLGKLLLSDADARIRGTAATALRQMFFRDSRTKKRVMKVLREALNKETDADVQKDIVAVLQDLLGRRFGLVEDMDEGEVRGDIAKSVEKARKVLAQLKS